MNEKETVRKAMSILGSKRSSRKRAAAAANAAKGGAARAEKYRTGQLRRKRP